MDNIRLLNGDCLELMKDIPDGSVNIKSTDPPYGMDYQSNRIKDKTKIKPKIANERIKKQIA
jgi:DNA modification methylase